LKPGAKQHSGKILVRAVRQVSGRYSGNPCSQVSAYLCETNAGNVYLLQIQSLKTLPEWRNTGTTGGSGTDE